MEIGKENVHGVLMNEDGVRNRNLPQGRAGNFRTNLGGVGGGNRIRAREDARDEQARIVVDYRNENQEDRAREGDGAKSPPLLNATVAVVRRKEDETRTDVAEADREIGEEIVADIDAFPGEADGGGDGAKGAALTTVRLLQIRTILSGIATREWEMC